MIYQGDSTDKSSNIKPVTLTLDISTHQQLSLGAGALRLVELGGDHQERTMVTPHPLQVATTKSTVTLKQSAEHFNTSLTLGIRIGGLV